MLDNLGADTPGYASACNLTEPCEFSRRPRRRKICCYCNPLRFEPFFSGQPPIAPCSDTADFPVAARSCLRTGASESVDNSLGIHLDLASQ